MEYRESRCPHCNEVMQTPVGRKTIICMFCGKEFSPEERQAADKKICQAQIEALRQKGDSFFADYEKISKGFQRNTYKDSFAGYVDRQRENLDALEEALETGGEEAFAALASVFVQSAKKIMDGQNRLNRQKVQMSLNMFAVTYVLPAVRSLKSGEGKVLSEKICETWAETFPGNNIHPADFAELDGGFKRKLCYITTAVCESLDKSEECRELAVLKHYRDDVLLQTKEGRELVEQYYDMAPTIVKRIDRQPDSKEIYYGLWKRYISPCVALIEENRNGECLEKYTEMVEKLRETYFQGY